MNKLLFLFFSFIIISCSNIELTNKFNKEDSINIGKYKTEYIIYWTPYSNDCYTIYSDDSIYTCSFQGTNFLLERNNKEELFSTTAPIKIKSCYKIQ